MWHARCRVDEHEPDNSDGFYDAVPDPLCVYDSRTRRTYDPRTHKVVPITESGSPRLFALRPYQAEAIERLRHDLQAGKRRLLLVSPTGSGKTATAAHMIARAIEKGREVLFVAHRREILFQTREKLTSAGIDAGWIMAGVRPSAMAAVHLASVQTLIRRQPPNAGLVIWDEAHHCVADSYRRLIDHYRAVPQIGLTATPCRADGRGLGGIFESLIQAAKTSELVEQGYLVPARIFAPSLPDLRGVRVRGGDYVERDLEERVDQPKLVGDVVEHWERHASGKKTIVFAVTRAHAQHLLESFQQRGHRAWYVDGETHHTQRKETFAAFGAERNGVLVNVGVATEGYDNPAIGCLVLARPTKSLGLYLQMAGRGLRPAEGKDHLLILDHSGASLIHGYPDEDIDWQLDPDRPAAARKRQTAERHETQPWVCQQCHFLNQPGVRYCAACGLRPAVTARSPAVVDGNLREIERRRARRTSSLEDREREWIQCVFRARNLGMRIGAAYHMYHKRFGCGPHHTFRYLPHGKREWNMSAAEFVRTHGESHAEAE